MSRLRTLDVRCGIQGYAFTGFIRTYSFSRQSPMYVRMHGRLCCAHRVEAHGMNDIQDERESKTSHTFSSLQLCCTGTRTCRQICGYIRRRMVLWRNPLCDVERYVLLMG